MERQIDSRSMNSLSTTEIAEKIFPIIFHSTTKIKTAVYEKTILLRVEMETFPEFKRNCIPLILFQCHEYKSTHGFIDLKKIR